MSSLILSSGKLLIDYRAGTHVRARAQASSAKKDRQSWERPTQSVKIVTTPEGNSLFQLKFGCLDGFRSFSAGIHVIGDYRNPSAFDEI